MTREEWLQHYIDSFRVVFKDAQYTLPPSVRVSIGFPCKQALGPKRRIGECHHAGMADGIQHIFISPTLECVKDIGATLAHELCHVITPGAQHKGKFITAIRAIGLAGKPTATIAGPDLSKRIEEISQELIQKHGAFPHAKLVPHHEKKQGTRLLKMVCSCEDPRILRVTRKVIEQGDISCGVCLEVFEEDTGEGE